MYADFFLVWGLGFSYFCIYGAADNMKDFACLINLNFLFLGGGSLPFW